MPPCPLSTVRSLAMSEERRVRRFSLGGDSDLKVTVAVGSEGRRRGMCKAAAAYAHTSEPPRGRLLEWGAGWVPSSALGVPPVSWWPCSSPETGVGFEEPPPAPDPCQAGAAAAPG